MPFRVSQVMNVPEKGPAFGVKSLLGRFVIVCVFGAAFGYIEAAVVVYLREIFYPGGFSFPLPHAFDINPLWRRLMLTEVGREAATIVLISTGAFLFGCNRRQRLACFLAIFAVWDIFYYVWLKVLLDWPAALLDWDILFLIPLPWASPVLAPLLISAVMLVFSWFILHRDSVGHPVRATPFEWLAFWACVILLVFSLCTAGPYIAEPEYAEHFFWPLFLAPMFAAVAVFIRCLLKTR